MKKHPLRLLAATAVIAVALTTIAGIAVADRGSGNTNTVIDMPSTWNTVSGSYTYAALDVGKPGLGDRLSSIQNLSLDFAALEGGCAGGAPRFTIDLTDPANNHNTAFLNVYVGTTPSFSCAPNDGWAHSGNLADAAAGSRWAVGNGGTYVPYTDTSILGTYGNWKVSHVTLIVDSAWAFPADGNGISTQDIVVDNVRINGHVVTAGAITRS